MRILGIDPGLRTTGFGLIDVHGQRLHYVASGTIGTTPRSKRRALDEDLPDTGNLPARIQLLCEGITEVVQTYRPTVAALEIVFVNVNPQATLLLGQARGACLATLVSQQLPVAEYTALQMKKAVAGHGRAAKSQIQEMVRRLLQLSGLPGTDAADALGMAITHAHAGSAMAQLAKSTALQRRAHALYKGGRSY
ncbi:MAG: crossover junction endodeoxyribonuclease RuvC [Brachymonas sp.]|nr:crossover junction endodeoxyribonuclease RuvC [Brachymonas sp.]